MHFGKSISFACGLILAFFFTQSPSLSMEDMVDEMASSIPTTSKSGLNPIPRDPKETKETIKRKEKRASKVSLAPRPTPLILNPNHQLRRTLNKLINDARQNVKKSDDSDFIGYESAIVIYNPSLRHEKSSEIAWDEDKVLYLDEFDKVFFTLLRSKKTLLLMAIGTIEGGMAPGGMAPLVLYLSSNLLGFLPVGESAALGTIVVVSVLSGIPCMRQIYERAEIIGNTLFDHNGFAPSKETDPKPHIQKLTYEKVLNIKKTFPLKSNPMISFSLLTPARFFSFISATLDAAPAVLLFLEAEKNFPQYAYRYVAPMAAFYILKTYEESMDFFSRFAHAQKTNKEPIVRDRKAILKKNLREMGKYLNGPNSNELVNEVYKFIEDGFANKIFRNDIENAKERILTFSVLLVRCNRGLFYNRLKKQIRADDTSIASLLNSASEEEKNTSIAPSLNASLNAQELTPLINSSISPQQEEKKENLAVELQKKLTEMNSVFEGLKTKYENLREALDSMLTAPLQEMANLIDDISRRPETTQAQAFLEGLSVYNQGAATVGRILITQWAVQAVLTSFGVSEDLAFYSGLGTSLMHLTFKSIGQLYRQKDTFLSLQNFGSKAIDCWPLRWVGNTFSATCSAFYSLPSVAIISKVLGSNVPFYIKVTIAIATGPSDFASYFGFFKEKYNRIITGLMTSLPIKYTFQKRALLNYYIEEGEKVIDQLDANSTQELYSATQRGL